MNESNKWKDYFLKSSLPLEFEVKKKLKELGYFNRYEYTYLRKNENSQMVEFSYDLDSEKQIGEHQFELMIECKYRDSSTNWIFLPEEFNESDRGVGQLGYLNTNDLFFQHEYPDYFKVIGFATLAPLCAKGIEINSSGQNPKSISQAIAQLSYAIIDKTISGFEKQLSLLEYEEHLIYHYIPIIVTTANLYRLKANVTIQEIRSTEDLSSIADKESILLLEPPLSIEIRNHALEKLAEFEKKHSIQELNKKLCTQLKTNDRDYKFHINHVLNYPEGVLVIQFDSNNNAFKSLDNILKEIVKPSKDTIEAIDKMLGSKVPALDRFR